MELCRALHAALAAAATLLGPGARLSLAALGLAVAHALAVCSPGEAAEVLPRHAAFSGVALEALSKCPAPVRLNKHLHAVRLEAPLENYDTACADAAYRALTSARLVRSNRGVYSLRGHSYEVVAQVLSLASRLG